MRIAGKAWVDRREPPGCIDEERQRLSGASEVQEGLSTEALEHRAIDLIQRPGARRCEQCERGLGLAGQLLGSGGLERSLRTSFGVGRERCGALKKGAGRCQPAARTRTLGRLFQLARDVRVEPAGGVSAMPGPAIRIECGVGGCRERAMRGAARLDRCRAVDR